MDNVLMLLASPEAWVALVTLVVLEVVLGIDNLIFIAILTNKLPEARREFARRLGIGGCCAGSHQRLAGVGDRGR